MEMAENFQRSVQIGKGSGDHPEGPDTPLLINENEMENDEVLQEQHMLPDELLKIDELE
jgi:hypothetical protein